MEELKLIPTTLSQVSFTKALNSLNITLNSISPEHIIKVQRKIIPTLSKEQIESLLAVPKKNIYRI